MEGSANSDLTYGGVEIVTIIVGPKAKPFKIHKSLLCDDSVFFKAAFSHQMKEAEEQMMKVEEDEETFDLFTQWLYTNHYTFPAAKIQANGGYLMQPAKLYALAEKYEVTRLKECLIKGFFAAGQKNECQPTGTVVGYIYANTAHADSLKLLFADWWTWKIGYTTFPTSDALDWLNETPEFAVDLVLGMKRKNYDSDPFQAATAERYLSRA